MRNRQFAFSSCSVLANLPDHAETYMVQGAAQEGLAQFDAALQSYDKAMGLDQHNAQPLLHSGAPTNENWAVFSPSPLPFRQPWC